MRATADRVGRFFTISRSIFVAANSLRSRAFSASSSATVRLPGGVTSDGPRRAAATQLASVPLGMLTLAAACSIERPCVKTSFTASSRSAVGYVFFNFFIRGSCRCNSTKQECPKISGYLRSARSACKRSASFGGISGRFIILLGMHYGLIGNVSVILQLVPRRGFVEVDIR